VIRRRANSECYRRAQSRAIILISLALGTAIVIAAVTKKSFDRNPSAVSQPTTIPASTSGFTVEATNDFNFTLSSDGAPILHMIDGHRIRIRCNPQNDHWVGTTRHPVNIAWSQLNAPKVSELRIATALRGDSFEISVRGQKPELDNIEFTTTLIGNRKILPDGHVRHESIEYQLRSTLHATPAHVKAALGSDRIEYLDPWIEGIFWPERDGHDREIYDYFVFGNRDSLRYAPKLHIFPSLRDATYETLVAELDEGFFAAVDLDEPALYFRVSKLSGPGHIGICWWTWDPHFYITLDDASEMPPLYEMVIDEIPASITPGVMTEPNNVRIPFETDPDYQIPSFQLEGINRFDDMLDESHEWGWEPHSRACTLDRRMGFDDDVCATINGAPGVTTAWYTRALGIDYFDHKPLIGGHAVTAVVKTRDAPVGAKLGIICYHGAETYLYDETDPDLFANWSEPVTGTTDWQPVTVRFDATGYKRFKLVLEHTGAGQSWFDNLELRRDTTADGYGWHDGVVDWRDRDWSKPQALPRNAMKCSRPKMLEDGSRLVMAWLDCSATSPQLHLPAGEYRLVVRAKGDGCAADPPKLQLAMSSDTTVWPIGLDKVRSNMMPFKSDGEQPISFAMQFINDGPCDDGTNTVDKNVFIHEITIERID
jgi:hypothetical protein